MDFNELERIIVSGLKPKLESNKGLLIFARERSKFEGWLKVELIESFTKHFDEKIIYPEQSIKELTGKFNNNKSKKVKNFDIFISPDWLIELKTVNTNFVKGLPVTQEKNSKGGLKKTTPLLGNVDEVIKDIDNLKKIEDKNKAVIFIVFPLPNNEGKWIKYYDRIKEKNLKDIKTISFNFRDNIPGVIYIGLV